MKILRFAPCSGIFVKSILCDNVVIYVAVVFILEANKAPQPPIESTLLRQEDVETLVGLIRDIRYDLSMQVRPCASHGATKIVTITKTMMIMMQVNVPQVCFQYMKSVPTFHLPIFRSFPFNKTTATIDTTSNTRRMMQLMINVLFSDIIGLKLYGIEKVQIDSNSQSDDGNNFFSLSCLLTDDLFICPRLLRSSI